MKHSSHISRADLPHPTLPFKKGEGLKAPSLSFQRRGLGVVGFEFEFQLAA